jgi:hypothetical protein
MMYKGYFYIGTAICCYQISKMKFHLVMTNLNHNLPPRQHTQKLII